MKNIEFVLDFGSLGCITFVIYCHYKILYLKLKKLFSPPGEQHHLSTHLKNKTMCFNLMSQIVIT
jgi:hypothetical protein